MKPLSAIILSVLVLVFAVVLVLNPLRRSQEKIRASFAKLTPIGSSFESVTATLKENGYSHPELSRSHGFLKQERSTETVGVSSIHVHLGEYRNLPIPLATDVDAFWGFDQAGKLIDIWIWKTTDGP